MIKIPLEANRKPLYTSDLQPGQIGVVRLGEGNFGYFCKVGDGCLRLTIDKNGSVVGTSFAAPTVFIDSILPAGTTIILTATK